MSSSSSSPTTPVGRFDEALYRAERAVVATLLTVMGVVVFLDVVHRVSTRSGSWLANPVVIASVFGVLGTLAFRTRGDPGALWRGAATGVAVAAAQAAFVFVMPNGLVWSQTFALAMTLWLGCIGASLAAHDRRHLALDIGSKLWPPHLAPKIAALGHGLTALFCLVVVWLGTRSVLDHAALWSSTDGAAGNLSGLAIPKWVPAASIPYGMAALAFRFGLEGWRVWHGLIETEVDELAALGITVDPEPAPPAEGGAA